MESNRNSCNVKHSPSARRAVKTVSPWPKDRSRSMHCHSLNCHSSDTPPGLRDKRVHEALSDKAIGAVRSKPARSSLVHRLDMVRLVDLITFIRHMYCRPLRRSAWCARRSSHPRVSGRSWPARSKGVRRPRTRSSWRRRPSAPRTRRPWRRRSSAPRTHRSRGAATPRAAAVVEVVLVEEVVELLVEPAGGLAVRHRLVGKIVRHPRWGLTQRPDLRHTPCRSVVAQASAPAGSAAGHSGSRRAEPPRSLAQSTALPRDAI